MVFAKLRPRYLLFSLPPPEREESERVLLECERAFVGVVLVCLHPAYLRLCVHS